MSPCAQCGESVDPGVAFCPNCGFFLEWEDETPDEGVEEGTVRLPGAADSPPVEVEGVPERLRSDPATISCPSCSTLNEETRTFCRSCGTGLHQQPVPPPPRPEDAPDYRQVGVWLGLGTGVLAVGVIVFLFLSGTDSGEDNATTLLPAPTTNPTATEQSTTTISSTTTTLPDPVAVPPGSITATASSTLPDAGELTYVIDNTLDNDLNTAWNDGTGEDRDSVGVTLDYVFAEPVHLAGLELINGYVKSEEVFVRNESIATALISTDTGDMMTIDVDDVTTVQTFPFQAEGVTSVTITILQIHPGRAFEGLPPYTDTALSEIVFLAYP